MGNPEYSNGRPIPGYNYEKPIVEYKKYRKTGITEMRPYIVGENLTGITVSPQDVPTIGDMVARNPVNHDDQWLVAKAFFDKNYEVA